MITTCNVEGCVFRLVRCENCDGEFVYLMERSGQASGVGGASERAAAEDLDRRLQSDCDSVPCVHCGWLQSEMIPKARSYYRPGMRSAGMWLIGVSATIFVGLFVLFVGLGTGHTRFTKWLVLPAIAAFISLLIGTMLLALRNMLAKRFDFQDSSVRGLFLAMAHSRGVWSREDFEKMAEAEGIEVSWPD